MLFGDSLKFFQIVQLFFKTQERKQEGHKNVLQHTVKSSIDIWSLESYLTKPTLNQFYDWSYDTNIYVSTPVGDAKVYDCTFHRDFL